ncbi:hypothetical protein PHJA_000596300 [Phtheirospermum japonicum]|uniref:UspA domain-containing protein n=1 Tax=Phtheirospermum japonicum TaxID=374723 RepID=A0A830BIH6_9LAMI|nr:hypothetical protein PHJA_000596300 [Phtheirospermum japonicum]
MPGWCRSHVATHIRVRARSHVRVRSPSRQCKKTAGFTKAEEKSEFSHEVNEFSFNSYLPESECGNRVMVVVGSSPEAKGALEWALSHTVQSQDTIILLHVAKQDEITNGEIDQRAYDLLRSTKNICQLKRPEVQVETAVREGTEKGALVVEAAKRLRVSLLVLGHKKQPFLRRLQMIWASNKTRNRVVDYCIQNANCMTIAVRRKNKKYGGYLITTKRHKKFWLLA